MLGEIKGASYHPQTPDEHVRGISLLLPVQERSGFAFLIAYTKKENADSDLLLQVLGDQIHRLAESFGKEANLQHRFEQFLGALNETLAKHVREGHWNIPIKQLHAIAGIASSQEMYLSGTGELTALFLHKKPSQRYQVFNLFRSLQTEQSLPTWEKTFAIVLDGDLHPGDIFCITDKDLQRMLPVDELNEILSTLPPVSAVEKIRQYFPHNDAILLTIIKMTEEHSPLNTDRRWPAAIPQSNLSVEKMNSTEQTTEWFLDDRRPNVFHWVKKLFSFIQSKTDSRSRILKDLQNQGTIQDLLKRTGRSLWKVLLFFTKISFIHASRTISVLKNKEERETIQKKIEMKRVHIREKLRSLFERMRTLPRSTKYLMGGIIVGVLILIGGISTMAKSQARSQEETAYQAKLAQIEDLMERAAGAVIYKDENQARSLYVNAQTLIELLPSDTPQKEEKNKELTQTLQTALNEIRHLITVPNPPLLADLETVADGVFGNSIVLNSGTISVVASDGRVYTYNSSQKQFDVVVTSTDGLASSIATTNQENGQVFVLSENGSVYGVSLEKKEVSSLSIGDDQWVDLETYANRLYLLRQDPNGTDGQIIRFNRNGSSFTDESSWIKSKTSSLNQAVSLAIDGTIFVLKKDGTVVKFSNGSEEEWATGMVDPRIADATKIWTNAKSPFIYVLEPSTQRVIVFDKQTGTFVVQYRSNAFVGLTDFSVDEAGYTIYLLAGSKLYSIAASHIKSL